MAAATRDALLRRGRERLNKKAMRKLTGKVMIFEMNPTYSYTRIHMHSESKTITNCCYRQIC